MQGYVCWFCRLLSISLYWLHSASSNHNRIKSHVETLFEHSFVGPIFCNGMYEAYINDVPNKTVQNVVTSNQLISVTSKDEELCMMTSSNGNISCVAIEWGYDAIQNNTILHLIHNDSHINCCISSVRCEINPCNIQQNIIAWTMIKRGT